jgi:hypothetical protein
VNVIHPGNTDTERQEQLRQQRAAALGKTVEELRSEALVKNNTRRFGKPEDIAALALFCVPSVRATSRARRSRSMAVRPAGPLLIVFTFPNHGQGVLARAHGGWSHRLKPRTPGISPVAEGCSFAGRSAGSEISGGRPESDDTADFWVAGFALLLPTSASFAQQPARCAYGDGKRRSTGRC